jgi:Fic family protein
MLHPLPLIDLTWTDSRQIWVSLTDAHRHLAELKGLCESLPSQGILLDTLGIQEAKDSSEIENIITTHDELYIRQEGMTLRAVLQQRR